MQLCAAWIDLESDSLDSQPADGPHAKAANLAKGGDRHWLSGLGVLGANLFVPKLEAWKRGKSTPKSPPSQSFSSALLLRLRDERLHERRGQMHDPSAQRICRQILHGRLTEMQTAGRQKRKPHLPGRRG